MMSIDRFDQVFGHLKLALMVLVLGLFLGGCATAKPMMGHADATEDDAFAVVDNHDPFENYNRSIYRFNNTLDKLILKPVTRVYTDYVPQPVRHGVRNFFSNLWEPTTMVNAALQGKPKVAAKSTARFLVNTTVGVLGLFDAATPMGIPKIKEDFGQTLAVWGVGDGPYLMLPFLGPSNVRDLGGLIVQYTVADLVSPIFENPEELYVLGIRLLDTRARLLGLDDTLDLQVDPYLFLRESYRQSRLALINDGVVPEAEEDAFEDELFGDG